METDLGNLVKISIEQSKLIEKLIDEKIRSDKVVEGVLKDINNSIERIADCFELKNRN